jgi:sigma-B regulation protein RsbU (phosphoserine phosphatase)
MEQDLQAARRVQSILLPRSAPDLGNLEVGIGWRPAREVSGDIFDFFKQSDDTAIFAFGDSSGKGAAAALYGSLVSGLLRTLVPGCKKPGQLMKSLNEILLERRIEASYVTLMLIFWSAQDRKMTVANAGALTPLICRRGQRLKLVAEGIPLGLLEGREYDEVTWTTEPGDVLLFFSDGVEDQVNHDDEELGHVRLFRMLKDFCNMPAQAIVDNIFAEVDRFRDGVPLADDQTLIAMKVR